MHRGPSTVTFTKTKGHALEDQEFLQKNPELRAQAIHNDKADRAAKSARWQFFNPNLVLLGEVLAQR
eukprot:2834776-Karenia_brevis.AAC.1